MTSRSGLSQSFCQSVAESILLKKDLTLLVVCDRLLDSSVMFNLPFVFPFPSLSPLSTYRLESTL